MAEASDITLYGKAFEPKLEVSIAKIQDAIKARLEKLVEQLNTKGGKLTSDAENRKILLQIEKQINDATSGVGLEKILEQYLPVVTKIQNDVISQQNEVNNLKVEYSKPLQEWALQAFEDNLMWQGIGKDVINPLKQAVSRAIVTGGTVRQLSVELKAIANNNIGGSFTRVLYDSMYQFEGGIQQKISNDFGFNTWLYTGTLVEHSRPQCVRWMKQKGGVLKFSELQNEIDWAYENGSGMVEGTTPGNFATLRGGWGCNHQVIGTIR